MKKNFFEGSLLPLAILSLITLMSCNKNDHPHPPSKNIDLIFYGLSSSSELVKYNAKAPERPLAIVTISGIESTGKIIAIDFRPSTGQLYGLGSDSRLYVINPTTGLARAVGGGPFTPQMDGTIAGFDFNPTVDRIRLVTDQGQNLRLNPETGAVAATDGILNPGMPMVAGAAYTNSVAGATTTSLFGIDVKSQKLVKQDPPNNGTLVEIGSLTVNATGESGFDIAPDNVAALASLEVNSRTNLYYIDLSTGKAYKLGSFSKDIIGLAIPGNPVAYSADDNNNLLIFDFMSPGAPVSKPFTGLQTNEMIVGLDMRPATGQLYALGSSSRIYSINMASAAATAINTAPFTPALEGTSFGFDFNPTVDRIRIVSSNGQNLRAHPETGAIAFTDMMLNPGTPVITAAAYTNNFAGATMTTLFDIDPSTDKLFTQNPPNNGTLVLTGSLGVDAGATTGFDIGGQSNNAYALLTVNGKSRIYTINLTTGSAKRVAELPVTANGLAIGLGF